MLLHQHQVDALHLPLIGFNKGDEYDAVPLRLSQLKPGDIVFAVSQQAVCYANNSLKAQQIQWPQNVTYLAIGESTARKLQDATQCTVVYPKDREISEHLLELAQLQDVSNKQVLILRGNGGRNLVAAELRQQGASVSFCECYKRCPIEYSSQYLRDFWRNKAIETIVITSAEMLRLLHQLIIKQQYEALFDCELVTVSERIASLARDLGWKRIKIADNADNQSLLSALI